MITSISNNRIKNLLHLISKSKARKEQQAFLIEGERLFSECEIDDLSEIYITQDFEKKCQPKITEKLSLARTKGIFIEYVANEVMTKISDTVTPQGIACICKMQHMSPDKFYSLQTNNPLLLILEDIQDPGNMGTILRVSEAAGVSGIVMTRGCVDLYNPKTVRSTMGSIFRMPILITDDIKAEIDKLKKINVNIYAAHLNGTKYYDEFDYNQGTAFMIGNEGNGLKEETAKLADSYLKIPMLGKIESLNAAMAAGILVYNSARIRRKNID